MSKVFMDDGGKIIIEDARIFSRNFSGVQTPYNNEGNRNFCVYIDDPELANQMKEMGWNVKIRQPRDPQEDVSHFISVNVGYKLKNRQPKITVYTSNGPVNYTEETVGMIDSLDIKSIDLIINPRRWDNGIKGYVESMRVIVNEDYFAEKYKNLFTPDRVDIPLEED